MQEISPKTILPKTSTIGYNLLHTEINPNHYIPDLSDHESILKLNRFHVNDFFHVSDSLVNIESDLYFSFHLCFRERKIGKLLIEIRMVT